MRQEKVKAHCVRAKRRCNCVQCNLDKWKRLVVICQRCHKLSPSAFKDVSFLVSQRKKCLVYQGYREKERERGKLSQMGVVCCSLWSASMYPKHLLLEEKKRKEKIVLQARYMLTPYI